MKHIFYADFDGYIKRMRTKFRHAVRNGNRRKVFAPVERLVADFRHAVRNGNRCKGILFLFA